MKRIILNISDGDKHFDLAVKEYTKRLGNMIIIESLKPSKNGTNDQIIQKDTEKIIEILERKYGTFTKVLLSKDGEKIDTINLSTFFKNNDNIIFIIGGPFGLNEDLLKNKVNKFISFGNITMPHGLAKLVLLEQIFRVDCIEKNKKYHY